LVIVGVVFLRFAPGRQPVLPWDEGDGSDGAPRVKEACVMDELS
jgi:hypothetical protein